MKDARAALGTDDDLVPRLRQKRASPPRPADRLSSGVLALTWPPIRGRQGEQQQG
jgi:hypothetical protein